MHLLMFHFNHFPTYHLYYFSCLFGFTCVLFTCPRDAWHFWPQSYERSISWGQIEVKQEMKRKQNNKILLQQYSKIDKCVNVFLGVLFNFNHIKCVIFDWTLTISVFSPENILSAYFCLK